MKYLISILLIFAFVYAPAMAQTAQPFATNTPTGETVELQPADDLDAILSVPIIDESEAEPKTWYESVLYYAFTGALALIALASLLGVTNLIENGVILGAAIVIVNVAKLTPWGGDDVLSYKLVDSLGGTVIENEDGTLNIIVNREQSAQNDDNSTDSPEQ